MDVWNYRGEGSWSFVALKRPGDARLFSVRNNTTGRTSFTRQSYRRKGDLWVAGKPPAEDYILNPKDKPRAVPVIDIPTVLSKDMATSLLFRPWYVLYLPEPTSDVSQLLNVVTEGAVLFRKVSDALTSIERDTLIIGIAVANINDATCLSSIIDADYYDTTKEVNAA